MEIILKTIGFTSLNAEKLDGEVTKLRIVEGNTLNGDESLEFWIESEDSDSSISFDLSYKEAEFLAKALLLITSDKKEENKMTLLK